MATIEIIAFVFGGFLLLVAILGGGFQLRELRVPRVGWTSRMMSSLFGVVFIAVGLTQVQAGPGAPSDPEIEIVEESADWAEPDAAWAAQAAAEEEPLEGMEAAEDGSYVGKVAASAERRGIEGIAEPTLQ